MPVPDKEATVISQVPPVPPSPRPNPRPASETAQLNDPREKYVAVEPKPGILPFRGFCTKCGFQSYQLEKKDAHLIIMIHAARHVMEEGLNRG